MMETNTGEALAEKLEESTLASNPEDGPEALHRLVDQVPEILDYLSFYLRTQTDRAKFSIKKIGGYLFLGMVALFLLVEVTFLALSLLFRGLSEGVGLRFPLNPWLGPVLLGGGVILLFLVVTMIGFYWIRKGSLRKIKQAYQYEFNEQKIKYGHSIQEQAAANTQEKG